MGQARLDAVLFDVDDTLYSSTRFTELARERAIQAMSAAGLRTDTKRLSALLNDIIAEYRSNYPYQFDELLSRVPRADYEPVNSAMIVAAGVIAYHDTKFRELKPYPDVMGAMKRLRSCGLKLGVVTSGVPTKQAEKIIRLGMAGVFEREWIFVPEQMNLTKQDPRLWREVCEQTGVRADRMVYIGDNPVMDVDPPNDAGFITVLARRGGKYANVVGRTRPRHEVADFADLERLLAAEYDVDCGSD